MDQQHEWPEGTVINPIGYQGAAQHTYTPGCDGFHEPGQCKGMESGVVPVIPPHRDDDPYSGIAFRGDGPA